VVTARRNKAAALKLLKRIMKKYGPPRCLVTDRQLLIPQLRDRLASPIAMRSVVGSTIGRRIPISRFDGESGPCSGFEA
jgi:transposase-like protein